MTDLSSPLSFSNGMTMKNRFMLAPLTNQQSLPDGTLSPEEHDWLVLRAKGDFGSVMTAAGYVQLNGKGFEGQLGIDDDDKLPALARLARDIKAHDSIALFQLYHGGLRALPELDVVGASDDKDTGGRAMTTAEVEAMIEAFVAGAERAQKAGFDGAELHGAHSYLLCQFLSSELNRRNDRFGGSLENRARPVREIIDGIRQRCGKGFMLGLRLSPERMQIDTAEMVELTGQLMLEGNLDFIDMSLWDCFKEPADEAFKGQSLIELFAGLERGKTRLGVAGQIRDAKAVQDCLDAGADFVLIGRAAIAEHDFARLAAQDSTHVTAEPPYSPAYLKDQGVSPAFIEYLKNFAFVADS